METIEMICTRLGHLSQLQIDCLQRVCAHMPVSCDIAHAQVTLYIEGAAAGTLEVLQQIRPHTSFVQYRPLPVGMIVKAAEEPLLWASFIQRRAIIGRREWALGMFAGMQTFPLFDEHKQVIAVISFETGSDEPGDNGLLAETAYLLAIARPVSGDRAYGRLSPRDGILLVDDAGRITFADAAALNLYKLLGVTRVTGMYAYDRRLELGIVKQVLALKQPRLAEAAAGDLVIAQRALPIFDAHKLVRVAVIVADVTELKKKERELQIKSAVIKEIHHRVKNNLQTIASLLRLQARRSSSAEVQAALKESVNRIASIALVHEFLSQHDAELIDAAEIVHSIFDLVAVTMLGNDFSLHKSFFADTVILPSEQATALALVVNELVQNSIEHGFDGRNEGTLEVSVTAEPAAYRVVVHDDGKGLPAEFSWQQLSSLGLQIVRTLVEKDLDGQLDISSVRGTTVSIIIPRQREV